METILVKFAFGLLAVASIGLFFIGLLILNISNRARNITPPPPTVSKSVGLWEQVENQRQWDEYYRKLFGD